METLRNYFTSVRCETLCAGAALILAGVSILAGSFAGGAITLMLLAIYLKIPSNNSGSVLIPLKNLLILKQMARKPKNTKEETCLNELQTVFDKAMKHSNE